jgi:hypothetical protein
MIIDTNVSGAFGIVAEKLHELHLDTQLGDKYSTICEHLGLDQTKELDVPDNDQIALIAADVTQKIM